MKRSPLKPGGPLKRTATAMKRGKVKPVADRRRKVNRDLAAVVAEKRKTVQHCQGQPLIRAALSHPDNTEADRRRYVKALQACQWWNPERPHHPFKRSRGNHQSLVDPENIMMLDPSCDQFVTDEVRLSTRAGLLVPSTERQSRWGMRS